MSTPNEVPQQQPNSSDAQIRSLAMQLTAMSSAPAPLTLDQGVVVDVDHAGTPPTCSITLGGSSTQIDGVRYLNSYTPSPGDTVAVLRQNGSPLVIGHTADVGTATASTGGWANTSLSGVQVRRVMDNGVWKVQFQGHASVSSTSVMTMDALYIPSVQRVMSISLSNNLASRIIFNTSGVVTLQQAASTTDGEGGNTQTSDPAPTGGSSDPFYNSGGASAGTAHTHQIGHRHWMNGHTHGLSLNLPNNLWFDDIEYF